MTDTTEARALVERLKMGSLSKQGADEFIMEAADALTAALAENERLQIVLSDAVDALDLANMLLRQKPVHYAIPLTNQFNSRHAAADRARAALKGSDQ